MKIKDMIRQALSVVIVMLSGMQITYAQSITVRGNVRDDVEPLMGVTVQAKGDEKVLNFGCQMYTDGCVNSANDENGGWNAMRYGIAEALFKFDDNMEVISSVRRT